MPDISVIIGQFFSLFVDRIRNFRSSVTDIHTVKSCECVQQFCALLIFNVNSVTTLNNIDRNFSVSMVTSVC